MKIASSDRPIRVAMLHYRDSADAGGSLRVGETIANHLDPRRVSVEMIFAYGERGPVAKRAKVPCHFIGASGPKDFAAWTRARSLFKELRPEIIHFQDGVVWLRAALAGTRYKVLLHVHARMARERLWDGKRKRVHPFRATTLLRSYLKFTDAQACINHGARDALLNLGWIEPAKSCVVYNSIDISRFSMPINKAQSRAELELPEGALLVGMVARLVWEKGAADFLSIVQRLPDRWHGVICGDGPLKQELQQDCLSRGLANRVHFIGGQDDVARVYAALDAYAFVSHYEPFGLVLAEAMASGVPIFGIEGDGEFNEREYPLFADGMTELVPFARNGNYEAVVPDQILDRVAAQVADYGKHPENYREMIHRARTWVTSCFDARLQAEAMTRVYEDLYALGQPSQTALSQLYEQQRKQAESLLAETYSTEAVAATA